MLGYKRAQQYLLEVGASLVDVALASGFSGQGHFWAGACMRGGSGAASALSQENQWSGTRYQRQSTGGAGMAAGALVSLPASCGGDRPDEIAPGEYTLRVSGAAETAARQLELYVRVR